MSMVTQLQAHNISQNLETIIKIIGLITTLITYKSKHQHNRWCHGKDSNLPSEDDKLERRKMETNFKEWVLRKYGLDADELDDDLYDAMKLDFEDELEKEYGNCSLVYGRMNP